MKTKIVTALILISVVFSGIVGATEPKSNTTTGDYSYYNQADFGIESWMVDLSTWVSKSETIITEVENALSVEQWMLKPDLQSWGNSATEESIQFEKWMIDIRHFEWSDNQIEPELEMESWMFDLTSWATS